MGSTQKRVKQKAVGGILPRSDNTRFLGTFISKKQLANFPGGYPGGETAYVDTLRHESLHAFTQSIGFGHTGGQIKWSKTIREAIWQRDGTQINNNSGLPKDARRHMFVNTSIHIPDDPIGDDDWIPDAYDAAMNGESGIRNYSPSFNTPKDREVQRLLEASNRAYWIQAVASNDKQVNGGGIGDKDPIFVQRAYSATNAEETLATLHAVMTSEYMSRADLKQLLEELDEFYPWLLEAWLGAFNPGTDQSDILSILGYIL
jgi:hypothetical protein